MTIHSLGPVKINTTTVPVLDIQQSFAHVIEPAEHTGQLYPMLQLVRGSEPRLTLTMPFAAAYDLIGMDSLQVTALDVWFAKYTDQGVKSTSTDHRKLTLDTDQTALAAITSIDVAQDGLLTASVDVVCRSDDGQTHPLTPDTGSLPTLSSQPDLHTLGPVELQGTAIDRVQGWSIDMGQRIETVRTDGDLYPTVVAYRGGAPTITIDHASVENVLSVLDLIGEAASTDTVLYARQHSATSGLVVGGATAVSITLAGGFVHPDSITASQDGVASPSIVMLPQATTVDTHPLTVSTSATAP
jgi:hypothetical protein